MLKSDSNRKLADMSVLIKIKTCLATIGVFFLLVQPGAALVFDEADLDAIYSQSGFGNTTIDIRIRPEREIVAPDLVDIDVPIDFNDPFNFGELDDLFAFGTQGPVIDVMLV